MNNALRGYVTRVGFNLTLSIGQMATLIAVDKAIEAKSHWSHNVALQHPWAFAINSGFVTSLQGLHRRGLVEHHPQDSRGKPKGWNHAGRHFTVTNAGKLVIELLKESGIYQEIEPTLGLRDVS